MLFRYQLVLSNACSWCQRTTGQRIAMTLYSTVALRRLPRKMLQPRFLTPNDFSISLHHSIYIFLDTHFILKLLYLLFVAIDITFAR